MGIKIENTPTQQDTIIDELLKAHGKRMQPDEMMARRAKNNVSVHWQASVAKQQQRQRKTFVLRMAAAVMLMVSAGFFVQYNLQNNTTQSVAHSLYVQGEVLISTDHNNWQLAQQGDLSTPLNPGVWLKTNGDSYANITLADNSQLRINQNTQLQLVSQSEVKLLGGEIYHDADGVIKSMPITISTSLGNINHIGTRYLVNKNATNLQVAVRNGLVEISNGGSKKQLQAGRKINIKASGEQQESTVLAYDRLWQWTQAARLPFTVKDKSLYDFVRWYAHENGYEIDWNQQQFKTKRVKLSGKLSNLTKDQQIKTVFLSTRFDYNINQGILRIL